MGDHTLMLQLTDLSGNPVWVFKAWVQTIGEPMVHEYNDGAGTVLVLSGERLAVRESPKEVVEKINGNPR